MAIRVLSQQLINQIAAGEVVVNMASVVKELVENSIDAGSTSIELELSKDLLELSVQDNGCGMNEEDAEMSLQRHATSKIRNVDDLFALNTRGFRGEAVPSIASVSRMEIRTRPTDQNAGTRLVVNGGRIEKIEPVGCPKGTQFIIRDLFFNTPARRKFLKSTTREMNLIMKTVIRQALAEPSVGIRVLREGDTLLDLPSTQTMEDRFLQMQGSRIDNGLLPLRHERLLEDGALLKVTGFLAHPHSSRGDRSAQYLFVNKRPFSQKQITASIEQACRGFIMIGRFPIYCLFLELDGREVDFNVHPTKEEVRFRDERAIAGAAYRAVREVLERHAIVPDVQLTNSSEDGGEFSQHPVDQMRREPEDFMTSPKALIERAFEQKRAREIQTDLTVESSKLRSEESAADSVPFHTENLNQSSAIPEAKQANTGQKPYAALGEKPDQQFWARPYEPEVLGQLATTFLIVRFGPDLLIVDQHAAHERLRFLELKRRQGPPQQQTLLVPLTFDVSSDQQSLLKELIPVFAQEGYELEPFGGTTWSITAIPGDLIRLDPVSVVLDVLDDMAEHGRSNRIENLRDQILIRTACHSSIRGGHQLNHPEMQELIALMQRHQLSFTCPHGRPTIIRLTKEELEKQFGRMGPGR